MRKLLSLHPHIYLLVSLSLIINFLFLIVSYRSYFCSGLIAPHGDVAYNFYYHSSLKSTPSRLAAVSEQQKNQQRLIDYQEVENHEQYGAPTHFRSVNDTLGYSLLLGILWKLTLSLGYNDIRWLQIIIFTLCLLLLYQTSLLIYENRIYALYSCLVLLTFSGIIFLNVRPLRDIWGFYGLVILIFSILRAHKHPLSLKSILLLGVGFTLCQWIRPTIFFTLIAVLPLLLWQARSTLKTWGVFFLLNFFLFWVPFIIYNKHAYNSYLVSCAGQDLYEGLGEFNNPWQIKMDDEWCAQHILNTYGIASGTPQFQAKLSELFWQHVTEKPLVYIGQLLRRSLQLIIFYAMLHEWEEYTYALSTASTTFQKGVINFMYSLDYGQRIVKWGCWYLLLGWFGLILLWLHNKKFEVLLLIIVALSGANKFLSHLESRYLIPHYAFFAFAISYLLLYVWQKKPLYTKFLNNPRPEAL